MKSCPEFFKRNFTNIEKKLVDEVILIVKNVVFKNTGYKILEEEIHLL